MLQPKKDNFRLSQADQSILEKEMIAYAEEGASDDDLIEFKNTYVAEKKKGIAKSEPTSNPQKSVSETPIGSSGGVNPAFKSSIPSPIPDFTAMQSVKSVVQKPKYPESENGYEPTFLENVVSTVKSKVNKLATGSSQLGADISAIPELLYDTAAIPQNWIADHFDIPSLQADSEKFKKNIGVRNAVKEHYQGEVIKLREHAKKVDTQYQDGIYDSFKNGDILGGFDQVTNSFVESLPATASIMLGGAYAKAPQLLTASTMVFGSGKNERLKDENPDMNTNARTINALGTGFAEGTFETMGSGSIGAAARGLIERQGAAKAATILKDGLVKSYKYALSKNPFTASLAVEGVEEWATQVTQNSIDVATGVKPKDFNIFDGAADAFIGGAFGGAVFGGGLKGIEQMTNLQDRNAIKTNIKNTQELQKALENPDISEETKLQIEKTIDGLVKTNQQLIIKNTKHADNLHPKLKEQLVESVTKIEETKQAVKAIKLDGTTNDAQKQILLDGLKEDFKRHNKLKADILEGKATPVDVLPLKEQDKIKRQALKELTAEQNPDGTKSIEIDNAQIVERANKIYKKQEELVASQEPITDNATLPAIPENYNIVDTPVVNNNSSLEQKSKEASEKIKRKDLFSAGGSFSNQLGESGVDSVPTNHTEINGIEFVEFSNPNTGTVDVVMSGTSDTDFVGYYRIYENGKPTDKWSSKFENQSRNKENFKTMIGGVQSMLPEGHQYTETTSISTDGLRVWEQQLSRGYELQTDENGNLVTNEVAINGDAIVNELGIDVNQGNFDNISVTNNQQFQSVKKALLPYLQKFGLNESNIRKVKYGNNVNGTVEIDLPVLRKTKKQNEQTPTPEAQPQAEVPQQAEAEKVAEVSPVEDVVAPSVEKPLSLQEENVSMDNNLRKEKQLEIINKSNPAPNSHNTWVRTVDDIKEAKDVFETAFNDGEMYPDFTVDDMKESLDSGEITIHSSRPIKNGSFVTPSRMNAEEYAGGKGSKIYSKTIKINDVAWIDESEGQYAPIKETKNAKPSKTNTPTNGNVQLGASNVGESGNAKPKSNSKSSVPSSVDGGEVKGEVEVSPFAEFEKIVNESKSVDEAFDKIKNIQGVSSETSKSFRDKYDPKGDLSIKEAFGKFYDEVKAKSVETAQVENKQKSTTKERIAERIKLSDAKIDEKSDAVKAKLKAFADMFPSADINPDDYHTNGFSADAIIDMVAKAAKAIAKGGIVTSEHIKEAIKAYNTHFDDEIDPKAVEERINPKKEAEKNSKDLLSKMTDVPNSGEIGKYISRDNIEDSDAEEEFTTNQDYDKLKLIDSLIYGKEIVEQAKADFGDNYIEELIKNINEIKNVDSKTLHIISLENDLRKRRKETTDIQEKEFLTEQINRLQPISQKLANTVSRALNLNKLRQLSESGVNPNDKSNSIYTKEELETKHEISKSFGKDINDIQEQYEESFQDETDVIETAPDNEENILKYSQEDFDRELQKAKDELGNDYNISVFENLKRQAKKDKLSDKKEDLKSAKAKVLEDIRKVVRESMGQMSVNPLAKPLEFATLVTKLAKLHIQDGALSLEEVSNSIYNDLKDMSKDITKESIFNILKSKPKKVMSEATKRKIYITLLNKNIESLDAQIEAKKRDVINRIDKYKNDAEIKDLRDKRAEKRDELAKVDPSYAESRKLATDLKKAQKSLDEYQRRIDENELSPKENQPKVVAEKLKKLRERRDAKRKEFLTKKKKYDDSLKPVAVPPTKEELVEKKYLSDVKNKINSLTKRIEDLKANKLKTNDGKSTIWNAKISELENELGKLKEKTKGGKETVKEKQNLTEEEIFQKKIDQKIRQTEKALQDHKAKKPKFAVGANSVWSKELSTIKTELTNLRNESSNAKKKAREIKNKAIELLINSGYGKEINVTKKEVDAEGNVVKVKSTKKILDWKKLAGESGSIANISKEIEKVLADQNLSKNEISEMVTEMKTAIEEIKTSITEKSLTYLQNRNKISKTVNVKTEAKNLSELYNQGIFDDNMDKYDIALNRILGFNKFRESQYQDLKDYSRVLSALFSNKNIFGDANEFMSEDALKTQVAHINKQINEIVNKASMGKGVTTQKVVSIIRDYSDMALLAKLLSLKQAVQNPISGYTERLYQKIGSIFDEIKLTPELKKQLDKGAWKVFKDITISGSPDLGDSSFSDIRSRKIDDKIRGIKMGKNAGKVRDAVSSIVSGTAYLNGADAYNKVKILEAVFAKAMIDILSNKNYGRNNIMTVKEATIFVSEALTGESFSKAIAKARQIIKDTNNEAGKDILPYTDANIYRLAMDVIRDNLTSTGIVDTETVKAVFAGSFKAAGSSLGHESNNPISTIYKNSSQFLDRKIKESVKEKNWGNFALYVSVNLAKNITMPFVSGRFNWAFLGAQITGANLGLSTVVTAYQKNKNKIDFSTEEGRSLKNLTESVHRKIRHDQTIKRSVVGLSLNVLVISALAASGGDDELEKFLEKSPNIKKVFKWIFPMIVLYFASQKGGKRAAIDFLLDFYSITGNEDRGSAITQFEILLDDKSTDKQNAKAKGVVGKAVGKAFDTPIPWRLGRDVNNVLNEIKGKEQYTANYNATSFLSGAFQGGFFEAIGIREMLSGQEEEKYIPKEDRHKKGAFSPTKPKLPSLKFNANPQ